MVGVRPEPGQAAVFDSRDHPAEGLANPAEGDVLLDRHPGAESTGTRRFASVTTVLFVGAGRRGFDRKSQEAARGPAYQPAHMTYRARRRHRRGHKRRSKILLALAVIGVCLLIAALSIVGYVISIAASAPPLSS